MQYLTAVGRPSTVRPSIDFETYSEAGYVLDETTGKVRGVGSQGKGGLPVVGTPAYAMHPSTVVLSLAYDLKDGRGIQWWAPGLPPPHDLLAHVYYGGPIAAWNVPFEWWIWNAVCCRLYGWPPLQLSQCWCDMAKARRFSLPGGLDAAAAVLGTPRKDAAGQKLLRDLSVPHSKTKARQTWRRTPATDPQLFLDLYRYNVQDVVAEDAAAAHIPDLTEYERAVWLVDQAINARGLLVDMPALSDMLAVLDQAERHGTLQLAALTGGAVGSVSEVAKMLTWLEGRGVALPDLQAETVAAALKRDGLPDDARAVLELRDSLGAANIKKLRTLALQVNTDGRLRGQYQVWGADQTGRWSAHGVQLQNMTAKGPRSARCGECGGYYGTKQNPERCPRCGAPDWASDPVPDWSVVQVEAALQDLRARDVGVIRHIWGDPVALLCGCLRGLFIAAPGHVLVCCDFSAIEAVVAACLTRCQWRIEVFSTHAKIYEASASRASGIPMDVILQHKKDTGSHHPLRKTLGKVRELAGGYGGWIGAWKNFGAGEFMTDEEIKADVLKWREESPEFADMWGGQFRQIGPTAWDCVPELYGLEGAAIAAVLEPGRTFRYLDISYQVVGDVLHCSLPSGRFLYYHRPRLDVVEDRLGRGLCYQLTFERNNTNAAKGPIGWHRFETYGGRLFENVVQAVAADIQAETLIRLEAAGLPVVLHTHDEAAVEVRAEWADLDGMVRIMEQRPAWASWWPIRAAGWVHTRYQKD